MKYRELVRLWLQQGSRLVEGKGDHEKWSHPALIRPVVITQSREVSPGVAWNALKAIAEVKGQNS